MNTIQVQGKGRVSAEPDIVILSFDVNVKARDYEECLRKLTAQTSDLRSDLVVAGLDKAQLKTSAFNVSIEQTYKDGAHKFAGYCGSHNLQIELPVDKTMLNTVLNQIAHGHSGAQINIIFSVKNSDALHKQVLTQAVQQARQNAETMAAAAGAKLGALIQMEYGWTEVHFQHRSGEFVLESCATVFNMDIEPADISAEDTVTLVYELVG